MSGSSANNGQQAATQAQSIGPHHILRQSHGLINGAAIHSGHFIRHGVARSVSSRPLNSWMAFRSFYSRIFPSMPQKEASTHLTKLWAKDPFKPKWQIIAEAYSLIRDKVGKASAPLDQFLGHVCPEIGIIRVSDYLKTMGWEVVGAVDGTITLQQMSTPDLSTLARKILLTPMSAHDLVRIVAAKSYITPRIALAIVTPAPNLPTGPPPPPRRMQGQLAVGLPSTPRVPLVFNESPIEAASIVLGFNVAHFMLTAPSTQPIEWTGNMADLYNPESGHIDHPDFQNSNEVDQEDQWHTTNISDPHEFSDVFTDSIRDGYMMPNVPEFHGQIPEYF